ncbi:hypothetical protein P7K49_002324 [Saguinus oedipus]|uniref:Uncharacterized protein n=1 Tax=Saguinus oedipus TaxID=9490 RepID=A0ABQ9WJQ2_SAGOE|nr:hypothetical protein P7K49_002324 [Saguinus oedipus]
MRGDDEGLWYRNRAAWPWVIAMGHRPMYCSNADMDDSTQHESKVRPLPGRHRGGPRRHRGGAEIQAGIGLCHPHLLIHPARVHKGLRGKLYGLEDLFYKHGEQPLGPMPHTPPLPASEV